MRVAGGRTSIPSTRSLLVVACLLVSGCAGSAHEPTARLKSTTRRPATEDAGIEVIPSGEEVPSLEALAARGPADMPLMREVLRSADAAKTTELRAGSADTCFRAAVAASEPVRGWFEDQAHTPRGTELSASSGLVPPRGPACARKGETLRLVVTTANTKTIARAVVWQTP